MKSLSEIKEKIKVLSLRYGMALSSAGMGAYVFAGMQNLSDFISDIVTLIPSLIPLVIVGVIIGVVVKFGGYIGKILKI